MHYLPVLFIGIEVDLIGINAAGYIGNRQKKDGEILTGCESLLW